MLFVLEKKHPQRDPIKPSLKSCFKVKNSGEFPVLKVMEHFLNNS